MSENGQSRSSSEERLLPHSVEAEMGVLSAMATSPQTIDPVAAILEVDDFFYPRNQIVYQVILDLWQNGITPDYLSIKDALALRGDLDNVGGAHFLGVILYVNSGGLNHEKYVEIVKQHANRRKASKLLEKAVSDALDPWSDLETTIGTLDAQLNGLGNPAVALTTPLSTMLPRVFDSITSSSGSNYSLTTALPFGLRDLDALTGGIHPGELTVVAGRPSIGKTALLLNIAREAARTVPVTVFSLEQAPAELCLRILTAEANVDGSLIRRGRIGQTMFTELTRAGGRICTLPVHFSTAYSANASQIRNLAKSVLGQNPGLVIVDYLQLLTPLQKHPNREREVAENIRSLKNMALDTGYFVLLASQLNRSVETNDSRPKLHHLRESGAIEQDADTVIMLHRQKDQENVIELLLEKQRNGPTGSVQVVFRKDSQRFQDMIR